MLHTQAVECQAKGPRTLGKISSIIWRLSPEQVGQRRFDDIRERGQDRNARLPERVGNRGKWRGQLDGVHGVVVVDIPARLAADVDERDMAVLGDAEFDLELS